MRKSGNIMRNEQGFTLVELMIVISIIAVLAVVLVPRIGTMRDSVKDQGVVSNVNSVRAYLELRTTERDPDRATEYADLLSDLQTEFTDGDTVTNPFTNGTTIDSFNYRYTSGYSVCVWNVGYTASTLDMSTEQYFIEVNPLSYGKVFVYVINDGYVVYGKNSEGEPLEYYIIQ